VRRELADGAERFIESKEAHAESGEHRPVWAREPAPVGSRSTPGWAGSVANGGIIMHNSRRQILCLI
jgi:hypothetical protein